MHIRKAARGVALLASAIAALSATSAHALSVTRLTPPSELFRTNGAVAAPIIARFIQGQRFDLSATIQPDAGKTVSRVEFFVDGVSVGQASSLVTTGLVAGLAANSAVAYFRALSSNAAGVHTLTVTATQNDGQRVSRDGNFEVLDIGIGSGGAAKNIIIMLGDGMGSGHRTAARIATGGITQGRVTTS